MAFDGSWTSKTLSKKDYTILANFHSFRRLAQLTLFISQVLVNGSIFAAGYQINEISTSLQGDATAGAAAAANDVSALFINPATMATLTQSQVYLGGSGIFPHVSMSDASATHAVNIPGLPSTPGIPVSVLGTTSQSSISKPVFVPNGYFAWRMNNKVAVGVALIAPFGLSTKYHSDAVIRFGAIYSQVTTFDLVPSIAYAITEQWAVGVGFQMQYISAAFSNFNGAYTGDPAIDVLVAATAPTYLKGSTWGYGYTLGALYKPDHDTRIGLGFRSQISEGIIGKGQQNLVPGGITSPVTVDFPFNAQTSVNTGIKTPAVLSLGVARDIYNWTIKVTAQINFWNTFNQLSIYMPNAYATNSTIQSKWQNTFFGAVGANYRFPQGWAVRGGLAFDQTPTQNAYRDPRIPDADRYWLTLGTTYEPIKNLSFDGAYEHVFVNNSRVNVTQNIGTNALSPTTPLETNHLYAKFKSAVDIVAIAVRYGF